MEELEKTDLSVCTVCMFVIAYGEYEDGTDAADQSCAGMARIWGDDARHLVSGGTDLGYSTSSCDACGNPVHSVRYRAYALIPKR